MTRANSPRSRLLLPLRHGLILAGLLVLGYLFTVIAPVAGTFGFDAFAYWSVDRADPYRTAVGGLGAFTYTPVAARVASVFGLLSWPAFLWLWTAIALGTVLWLGGRRFAWILAFPPVALELYHGNVHLLLAAMCVLGLTHPWAWAFGAFTKGTPGLGLVWFLVRREWRNLAVALGVIGVIGLASLAVDADLWRRWLDLAFAANAGDQVEQAQVAIPLLVRLPIAVALVAWGGLTDRRWTVPVAVTLGLPVLWPSGFAILAACLPLSRSAGRPWFRLGTHVATTAADPA